jgi:Leucine rich repeat
MDWLTNQDQLGLCPYDNNLKQRFVLALLFMAGSGEYWSRCSQDDSGCTGFPFLSPVHECSWHGIGCDSNNRVMSIHLGDHNVSGPVLEEIGSLEYLVEIAMDTNNLSGSIPSSFGELTLLTIIDMDKNLISGEIPEALYNLTSLRVLDLDSNLLSGTLSTRIGQLQELYFLQLDFNKISGSIPDQMSNFKDSIKFLSLFGNNFTTGSRIPTELCNSNATEYSITLYANCDACGNTDCCSACLQQ